MEKRIYNKEPEFKEKIAPVIKELKLQCLQLKLPMFVSVAVANDEKRTKYYNDMLLSSADTKLTDDRISTLLLSLNGFEIDYPKHIQKAMAEINDYIKSLDKRNKKSNFMEDGFSDDQLEIRSRIGAGGDQIVLEESGRRAEDVFDEL